MRLATGVDNEACLEWLESALQEAFEQRKPELWAYLEAVMEEVLFETEAHHSDRARMARSPGGYASAGAYSLEYMEEVFSEVQAHTLETSTYPLPTDSRL